MKTELQAIKDSRRSFHEKASVEVEGNVKTLYSYDTKILSLEGEKVVKFYAGDDKGKVSKTTMRHINEFIFQFVNESLHFRGITSKQYLRIPCNEKVSLCNYLGDYLC